jgi:ubiquinone/menaquinone biosynthesis C-methylase UbiE
VKEKVGLDISQVNLMLAKRRSSELMLVQADAEHIPFRQSIFDAIIIVDLLHHVPNPHRVIKEATEILRVGGKLLVYDACIDGVIPIIPLAIALEKISEKMGSKIEHFGPSLNDVTKWLDGFKIVNISGEGSFIRYLNAVLRSFSKRINLLPLSSVPAISAIDYKIAHLLKKIPN